MNLDKITKFAQLLRENVDSFAESVLTNTNSKFVVKEIQGGRNRDKTLYQLSLALPGFCKEETSITYENGVLTVSAGTHENEIVESLQMDSTFDVGLASARMNNGLLVIVIPKDPSGPREIKIQ